jgi:hypothetical protein
MGSYLASVSLAWVAFSGAFAAAVAVIAALNRYARHGALSSVAAGLVFGLVFVLTLAPSTGLLLRSIVRRRATVRGLAALLVILAPAHVIALWLVTREPHETWGTFIGAFPRGEWALFVPACTAGILAFIWREQRGGRAPHRQFAG